MKRLIFVLALLTGLTSLVCAQSARSKYWATPAASDPAHAYPCVRATSPIQMDGRLSDPQWQRAVIIRDFISPPNKLHPRARKATSLARARLMWNDKYLYYGIDLEDRDLWCHNRGYGEPFCEEDVAELFIKGSQSCPSYWEFHAEPSGAWRDYFIVRRGCGGVQRAMEYHSGMIVRTHCRGTFGNYEDQDEGWSAEMAIPWAAFKAWGGMPKLGDLWTFMVARYDVSYYIEDGKELSAAAPLPEENFHSLKSYPYLVFVE